jgi:hypothetical protein
VQRITFLAIVWLRRCRLGGGAKDKTIKGSWRSGDRDRVIYGARKPAFTA